MTGSERPSSTGGTDDGAARRRPQLGLGPAEVPGFPPGAAFPARTRLLVNSLTVGALAAAVALSPLYWVTFWLVAETVRAALGIQGQVNPAVPFVPSVLASWGTLYLATDRVALIGNAALRRRLARKARLYFGGEGPPRGVPRFFVEARAHKGRWHLKPDHGWLFLLPERLVFVGDLQIASVPRDVLDGPPERDENLFRLGPAWVTAPLAYPWGRVRLLARDRAARLSETDADARRLEAALQAWQSADYPSTSTQPPDAAER